MITVTIDNPELERVFHENFASDNDTFVKYISHSCHANNLAYSAKFSPQEIAYIESALDECDESDEDALTHEEVFANLRKKYDID